MATEVDGLLARVRAVVARHLAPYDVRVYLFGSHATGKANEQSDVDVAVDPREPLPPGILARLREALEESTIPCRVDVVDLNDAGAEFRARVRREGAEWSVSSNG